MQFTNILHQLHAINKDDDIQKETSWVLSVILLIAGISPDSDNETLEMKTQD